MLNFFVSRAFLIGLPVALTIYYLLPTARLQVPLLIVTSFVIFCFAAGNHSRRSSRRLRQGFWRPLEVLSRLPNVYPHWLLPKPGIG
jgi:hypothetical protein